MQQYDYWYFGSLYCEKLNELIRFKKLIKDLENEKYTY